MKKFKIAFIAALTAFLIFGLSSCNNSKKNDNTFYFLNWTYYTPDSVVKRFEETYNCKVVIDTFDSNEVMYTKLKAGATGYDLTIPSQDYTSILIKQGMIQKIDLEQFPNKKYINPDCLKKAESYDPDMTWCVPYCYAADGIAVNKTKVKDYPRDWTIFEQPEFAGHMTMMDDMRLVMGAALRHLGYSLNSTTESELKEAVDLLNNKWKPNILKFDAEGYGKSFAAGDFWVCEGYAEVPFAEVPEDKQDEVIDFFIPDSGAGAYLDSMVILKGAKHYDLAMKFINFIHEPTNYAEFLDQFKFPNYVNTEASKYTKKEPMYPVELLEKTELKMDVGEFLDVYNEYWQQVRF